MRAIIKPPASRAPCSLSADRYVSGRPESSLGTSPARPREGSRSWTARSAFVASALRWATGRAGSRLLHANRDPSGSTSQTCTSSSEPGRRAVVADVPEHEPVCDTGSASLPPAQWAGTRNGRSSPALAVAGACQSRRTRSRTSTPIASSRLGKRWASTFLRTRQPLWVGSIRRCGYS
jgi:hypothetical protein